MRFTYCPNCGEKLGARVLGDEGSVPWCEHCGRPWFEMFSSCVIILVTNDNGEVALLKQDFPPNPYLKLVAGYIKPGESAEESAEREVMEEIGIRLKELRLVRTIWFEKAHQLMIAFHGVAENTDFTLSPNEVQGAGWYPVDEAVGLVRPPTPGSASAFLVNWYRERMKEQTEH